MTTSLQTLSDADLRARQQELAQEVARREEERKQLEREARGRKNRRLLAHKSTLLALIEHGRTSCSDEDPNNGYAHYDNGAPRCNKCMLMGLEDWNVDDYDINIEVSIRQV